MYRMKFRWQGTRPLVMHWGRLADPTHPIVKDIKKITGKRKKTDEDHLELQRLEFQGGLYHVQTSPKRVTVCLFADAIEATIAKGATCLKKGKLVKESIICEEPWYALEYDGPKTVKGLFENDKFRLTCGVRVGTSRVMRTRPVFPEWAVEFSLEVDGIGPADMEEIMHYAGRKGTCDFRPRYGRFVSELLSCEELSPLAAAA